MSQRERVLATGSILFGTMWLVSATTKVAAPLPAYELVTHVVAPGTSAKALLAAAVASEVLLGLVMVLRVANGFALSLAWLAAASAVLVAVKQTATELVPCGCFGDLLGTTLDEALVRNAVIAAILVALIVGERAGRRPG